MKWEAQYVRAGVMYLFVALPILLALAGLGLHFVGIDFEKVMKSFGWVFVIGMIVLAFVAMASMMPRKAQVGIEGSDLVVERGARIERFPLAGARVRLARWEMAHVGNSGSALVVESARRTLRISGRDRLFAEDAYSGKPVRTPNLYLEADAFDGLRTAIGRVTSMPEAREPSEGHVRVQLAKNRSTGGSVAISVIAFPLVIAPLIALVSWGAMEILPAKVAPFVIAPFAIAIIVGYALFIQRKRARTLVVEHGVVRMIDDGGRVMHEAPTSTVRLEPCHYVMNMKGTSYDFAVLRMTFAGDRPFTLAAWDMRFRWRVGQADSRAPQWLVGPAEWMRLLTALGVGGNMEVSRSRGW